MTPLVDALAKVIGLDNVAFDTITRFLYSTDASNYQIVPVGVVFPRHVDDVCAIHAISAEYGVPIVPRGGGTSLAGQTVGEAIVIDFTRHLRRVTGIDAESRIIRVEPGLVLEQMNNQLKPLSLMFGPDPASANRATMGGCLANNSSGTHSILYRMTADHVRSLDVVLASGEKVHLAAGQAYGTTLQRLVDGVKQVLTTYADFIATRYPKTWRTVAGYALNRLDPNLIDLAQLIIGSEGTLGSIVGAELALVERPQRTALVIIHFDELMPALEIVPSILKTEPSAVELFDKLLLDRTRHQPEFARRLTFVEGDPAALLAVEYYGVSEAELTHHITQLKMQLQTLGHRQSVVVLMDAPQQANVWTVRKAGLGLLSSNRSDWKTVPVIEDAAVPVELLPAYIQQIQAIVAGEGAEMSLYAHASAGCLHVRPLLNLKTAEGLRQYRAIGEAAVEAVLAYGGTTSGEHGEGLVRGEFSERFFGSELTQAFREIKRLFDPQRLMNPGKVFDTPPMDDPALLRYGPDYATPLTIVDTRYDWSSDQGFAGAIEMCNGAGVCRKEESGVMCPSFMATREERDSTRGRANILRLAITGRLGLDGMHSDAAKSVLDLCLSCKACKVECPSSVDMARLKAEFMANYYDHHGIPLAARLVGNVHRLSRLASLIPRLSNMGRSLMKPLMHIAPERTMPRYAYQRFSQWWQHQVTPIAGQTAPILILDTYTEYFHPEIGQALAYLMTQGGYKLRVERLAGQGCCGRPALSKGLLDQAKQMATQNVTQLGAWDEEDPTVRFMFLEPSCASALIDDYPTLVDRPYQERAVRVAKHTISVEQWLAEWLPTASLAWDEQPRNILLHGHCHQKALWGTIDSLRLLSAIPNAVVSELDAGCCGMAGSYGYEHYDVSMAIAEQRLYPALRDNPDAILAASGTSCREQVSHISEQAKHPVVILAEACGWKG
ncbi:MAG: FAD-binding protein [Anaerolineales bacterium]|nr:FAD-binding protein [Anaerolineales bacterium]